MNSEATATNRPSRLTEKSYARLAMHITDRDRNIALDCYEHHVLTTDQIERLHFTGGRTTRARLKVLYELRVLDRFRPMAPRGAGSMPHHWVLDEAGAFIVADHRGIERSELRYVHADGMKLAASRNLAHHVEANEFFTRLALEANQASGALTEWYGTRTLSHLLGGIVIPDGYGVLTLPSQPDLHILHEHDRGTEPSRTLREKARRYAETLPRSSLNDTHPLVLLTVRSTRRAQTAIDAVKGMGIPVAVLVWTARTTRPLLPSLITTIERTR